LKRKSAYRTKFEHRAGETSVKGKRKKKLTLTPRGRKIGNREKKPVEGADGGPSAEVLSTGASKGGRQKITVNVRKGTLDGARKEKAATEEREKRLQRTGAGRERDVLQDIIWVGAQGHGSIPGVTFSDKGGIGGRNEIQSAMGGISILTKRPLLGTMEEGQGG